jgi:predicted enzyme related to lactoylglutathione lyase
MFTVTRYPHGTFSWADCSSTDAASGKRFYADIMGWEIDDRPIGNGQVYTMFKHDGHSVAAISQILPDPPGMPSVWTSYITVDDVDALADKVPALGGVVFMPPMDVLEEGRMMMIQDPTGAPVALWQAKNHIGAGLVNTPGAMTWNELAARDLQKAEAFYGTLLGWTFQPGPTPGYRMIFNGARLNGGIIQMDENWGDMPAHWMVYFSVANLDEALAKVEKLGGKLGTPVVEAPGTGRFAVVIDPQGATCTLIQLTNPLPWSD